MYAVRRTSRPVVLLTSAALAALTGCGGGNDPSVAAAPQSSPSAAAPDPKAEWISAVTGLCTTLAGAVSGRQLQLGSDGKITPKEIVAAEEAARPAVEAFDSGLAALTAPPEAAAADKALKDLLARNRPSAERLVAAAKSGDQAAVTKVLAEREKLRLSPEGMPSLKANGLPDNCNFRASYT